MSFSKIAFLVFLLPLAACAKQIDPKTLTEATVPSYAPPKTATGDMATIKGTYTRSTGLLGTPESITFLAAIDGKFYNAREDQVPNPVPAGKHMVAIGFAEGGRSSQVPAYVEFKPGVAYVIKYENTGLTMNSINTSGPDDTLWIEEEKTGVMATSKLASNIYDSDDRYVPPAGATSTISGFDNGKLIEKIVAFVQMIDGKVVDGDGKASILGGENGRTDYAIPLTQGRHGFAIRVEYGMKYVTFPIMFDAKSSTSYVVKLGEYSSKLYNKRFAMVIPLWIEETSTGLVAYPKIDLPFYVGRKYTPEQLGKAATPPAAPPAAPK